MSDLHGIQAAEESKWWLWPLMPFAAVLGATLGTMILGLIMWLGMKFRGDFSEEGWYYLYIMPVITSVVWGVIFSYISYSMPPKGNLTAGTVMVTVLGVLVLLMLILIWANGGLELSNKIQSTVGGIATMAGAVGGLVSAHSG